ncbi:MULTISPECIES: tetratricopeptide repeat protein [unclassified Pseudomonas]|uniref:tetratricopeptide repeat protein n=1 Tax=unclassified Pseudomonas TaxID=196821 RepID=UPI000A1FDC13|nr:MULTISPECIES: sel1 repeat family protein [unclassified Pseudomonas]MDI2141225.1 sel1 repeat family protein [Pseudomonas sp. ITA]
MTKNNRVRQFKLQCLVLLAFGFCSDAFAAQSSTLQCPSDNFADFVKEFSSNSDVQQAFIASPVIEQTVVATDSKPRVVERKSRVLDLQSLVMLAPDNTAKSGLSMQVQLPNNVIVRDSSGEVLKIFTFKHNDCWVLTRAEDWSLESALDAQYPKLKASPAERALKRGVMYNQLAIDTESSSSSQLYISALNSYLHGADQGSPEAAFAAAGISLSGQAPRLENAKILQLLESAAKSVPEAGIALAEFYCDEGNYEETRACVSPEKSLSALVTSAQLGSPDALIQLGGAYETGAIIPSDLVRAMACYQEADKKGNEAGARGVERLRTQGIAANNSIHCL